MDKLARMLGEIVARNWKLLGLIFVLLSAVLIPANIGLDLHYSVVTSLSVAEYFLSCLFYAVILTAVTRLVQFLYKKLL